LEKEGIRSRFTEITLELALDIGVLFAFAEDELELELDEEL
jgi:hypothetical protein